MGLALSSLMDRLGIDDEAERLRKVRQRREDAKVVIPGIKQRYVDGKSPEDLLRWAKGLSHLGGNRFVRKPSEADQDEDLFEVTHVVEATEPHERGLVVYHDARNGQLYSYPYSAR